MLPSLKLNDTYSEHYDPSYWEKLDFTSSDPCRTNLIRESDNSTQYTATTVESGSNPVTTFKDASGTVIGTLNWRLYLPDKLVLEGQQPMVVGKWLKVSHSTRHLKERYAYGTFRRGQPIETNIR